MPLGEYARFSRALLLCLFLNNAYAGTSCSEPITPNDFQGTDTERIQLAIDAAKDKSNVATIPRMNANGTSIWKIDHAVLLPSDVTVILDNCVIQLSDACRDNMFRSDNVGIGKDAPTWNQNIQLLGVGNVVLKGADNPRATGDAYRQLAQDPDAERVKGNQRVSYGSDAGVPDRKQYGDWRNNLIMMAYVDGFALKNVKIENSHAWAVCFERTRNAVVSDIVIHNPEEIAVGSKRVKAYNKDGVNLRHGCKHFRIANVSGINGDDLIALSNLDVKPHYHGNGDVNSYQVTSTKWNGPEDDIEHVTIVNCQTNYAGVALRASDNAGIRHVYINGVITKRHPDVPPPYGGSPYSLLVGGIGYGEPVKAGLINNIYATNIIGDGKHLILIEAPLADCLFTNGLYSGEAPEAISYNVPVRSLTRVTGSGLIKVK